MAYNIDEILGDIRFEVIGDRVIFKLKEGIIPEPTNDITNLIKVGDITQPSDSNVFSSLRVLSEIAKAVGSIDVSGSYLRKDVEDTAAEQISFGKGIKIGNATLTWDAAAGALRISESVFSDKEVSAYGSGNSDVGGAASSLWELKDVSDSVFSSTEGSVLQKVGNEWVSRLFDHYRRGLTDSSGNIIESPEQYKLRVPKPLRYVGLSVTLRTNITDTTYTKYEFKDGIEDYDFVPVNYFIGIEDYIEDSFESTSTKKALSANKGRELYQLVTNIDSGTY